MLLMFSILDVTDCLKLGCDNSEALSTSRIHDVPIAKTTHFPRKLSSPTYPHLHLGQPKSQRSHHRQKKTFVRTCIERDSNPCLKQTSSGLHAHEEYEDGEP